MAISQTKYIDITSGVGGEATASRRELIGRVISSNSLIPVDKVLELNQSEAATYFGDSDEGKIASKYFAFISKSAQQANKISFARYVKTATAPFIRSTKSFSGVSGISSVTDGGFVMTIGGTDSTISSLDFSSVTSLSDVADVIDSALPSGTASCSFVNGAFMLVGDTTGNIKMSVSAPASGTNILPLIGFDVASNPIISSGGVAETPKACMERTTAMSDNFGSFMFVDSLTDAEKEAVAEWNAGKNVMFIYSVGVDGSTYADTQTALAGQDGTGITYDAHDDYAEYMPMVLLATTPYNAGRPATKNYMYQQFLADEPSVDNDTLSKLLDGLKINYLGSTSQAGSTIAFYQDGVLQGSISDMAVYGNEIWLKDAIKTEFMNLLVGLEQLPANDEGRGLARGSLQSVIDEALVNGVIQAGKTLTNVQRAYITSLTADVDAWRDVENLGYWLDVQISQYVENDVVKYKVNYLLIYSKGDSIRKVEGTDILI